MPAHLEVAAYIRIAQAAGGFATVLAKGEPDAGTIMVICCHNRSPARAYERMPQHDGVRAWTLTKLEDHEKPLEFSEYWQRRRKQDPDLWIVEIDLAEAETVLGLPVFGQA